MISLAEERRSEIKALRAVVETMRKVAAGEARGSELAKSMRTRVQAEMKAGGASDAAIAAIKQSPMQKQKMMNEFSSNPKIEEEVSMNQSSAVDTTGLLTGDSNEELRMQPRLIEKAENAKQGKMARVTINDVQSNEEQDKLIK